MLATFHFTSKALTGEQAVQIILPDKLKYVRNERVPVLYLLHGMWGDYTNWTRYTALERYAQAYNLAVVMPSGLNSFYHDLPGALRFEEYVAEELPQVIGNLLPVSDKREENFIAGLSMGGYGAFYLGLRHSEQYSCIGSFSGPLDFYTGVKEGRYLETSGAEQVNANPFEPLESVDENSDLFRLLQNLPAENRPALFVSCGRQDFIYPEFIKMRDFLTREQIPFTAQDGEGEHNWAYWDRQIQDLLAWLPLEKS